MGIRRQAKSGSERTRNPMDPTRIKVFLRQVPGNIQETCNPAAAPLRLLNGDELKSFPLQWSVRSMAAIDDRRDNRFKSSTHHLGSDP